MKVLLSAASFDPATGGPAHSVPALGAALAVQGLEVALWAPDCTIPRDSGGCSLPGGRLEEAIARFGMPDLIHDNGIWLPHHHRIAAYCRRRGIPRVVSARGMLEPWALRNSRARKRIAWLLYQHRDLATAQLLHATAPEEAANIAALGIGTPVCTIANGVDLPEAVPIPPRPANRVRELLYLGRLHSKKGLPMLLAAWRRVAPQGWRLRIAGPDEQGHAAELLALARELGIADAVHLEGPVYGPDKARLYDAADLFALPTHSENFGLTVAEALAHGVPVLTTTGAPWGVLTERGCGWWVAPGEAAIAGALAAAIALDDDARVAMGHAGRALVAERFAWPGIAAQFSDRYRMLAGRD